MSLPVKLDEKSLRQQKNVAKDIVGGLSIEEQNELELWCNQLIQIRKGSFSKAEKIKQALKVTFKASNIFSVFKLISTSIKKYAWDDRKTKGRLGILGLGVGLTFFAGQAAGVAALGSAVGVPLWVVFGAGGTFVGFILEEIERNYKNKDDVEGSVIDAEYNEVKTRLHD